MPKQYRVHRDQAVWERETFRIEVPDEVPPEEHYEYIEAALSSGELKADYVEIQDSVEGVDVQIAIEGVFE